MSDLLMDYFAVFGQENLNVFVSVYRRALALGVDPVDLVGIIDEYDKKSEELFWEQEEEARKQFMLQQKERLHDQRFIKRTLQKDKSVLWSKCPECGGKITVRRIKIPQGKNNLYGWDLQQLCMNGDCLYEKYLKIDRG